MWYMVDNVAVDELEDDGDGYDDDDGNRRSRFGELQRQVDERECCESLSKGSTSERVVDVIVGGRRHTVLSEVCGGFPVILVQVDHSERDITPLFSYKFL